MSRTKIAPSPPAEFTFAGTWFYDGYHGRRSICYLWLYQPRAAESNQPDPPAVAIFTEAASNPGTSITNRIEILAGSVWGYLGQPDKAPLVIEHYPARGWFNPHNGGWQFPEKFNLVELDRKPDGGFCKPRWKPLKKGEVEALIGQKLPKNYNSR